MRPEIGPEPEHDAPKLTRLTEPIDELAQDDAHAPSHGRSPFASSMGGLPEPGIPTSGTLASRAATRAWAPARPGWASSARTLATRKRCARYGAKAKHPSPPAPAS